jgi:hypothetical protein
VLLWLLVGRLVLGALPACDAASRLASRLVGTVRSDPRATMRATGRHRARFPHHPSDLKAVVRATHGADRGQALAHTCCGGAVGAVDALAPGSTGPNLCADQCDAQDSAAQRACSCVSHIVELKLWVHTSNRELTGCANTPQSVYGGGITTSQMAIEVDS